MKIVLDANVLISAAELGEAIGADAETVSNWIRRDVISRAQVGGRQLVRHRLFKPDEVYKAALTQEFVKLRMPPSPAGEAARTVWREWKKVREQWDEELPTNKNVYAMVWPSDDSWAASLGSISPKGPIVRIWSWSPAKSLEEIEFPDRAFAMIHVSRVFTDITKKLVMLLEMPKREAKK